MTKEKLIVSEEATERAKKWHSKTYGVGYTVSMSIYHKEYRYIKKDKTSLYIDVK